MMLLKFPSHLRLRFTYKVLNLLDSKESFLVISKDKNNLKESNINKNLKVILQHFFNINNKDQVIFNPLNRNMFKLF